MKIHINEKALRNKMCKKEVYTFRELCEKSGVKYVNFCTTHARNRSLSLENYWLIADFLGCHIEELQEVDWTK